MTVLVQQIEASRAQFSAAQMRIAEFILANPFLVATMGIEELAQANEVSPASITRFVRQLGLKNYAEFRASAVSGYQSLLRPIENVSRARQETSGEVASRALAAGVSQLENLRARADADQIERLAASIVGAKSVGFLGFGSSARALRDLAGLSEAFNPTQIILDGRGGMEVTARRLARMGPQDLLIVMTLPRYSRATLDLMPLARSRGVPSFGITDRADAPLAAHCADVIAVPSEHPVLHSSTLGAVAMFETIASVLAARYQSTNDAATLTRVLLPYLYADEPMPEAHSPKGPDAQ